MSSNVIRWNATTPSHMLCRHASGMPDFVYYDDYCTDSLLLKAGVGGGGQSLPIKKFTPVTQTHSFYNVSPFTVGLEAVNSSIFKEQSV